MHPHPTWPHCCFPYWIINVDSNYMLWLLVSPWQSHGNPDWWTVNQFWCLLFLHVKYCIWVKKTCFRCMCRQSWSMVSVLIFLKMGTFVIFSVESFIMFHVITCCMLFTLHRGLQGPLASTAFVFKEKLLKWMIIYFIFFCKPGLVLLLAFNRTMMYRMLWLSMDSVSSCFILYIIFKLFWTRKWL